MIVRAQCLFPHLFAGDLVRMNRLSTSLAVLACALGASCAAAADIATPSGMLSLEVPAGYTELTAEELQSKFGRHGRVPLKAYGNARRSSTVAVTWSQMKQPLTEERLPELKAAMEGMLPRLTPGLEFKNSQMVTVGERAWVLLDSTAPAVDTEVRNLMYLTDLGGHMVAVNYNATLADYPAQVGAFAASARSLRVRETPGGAASR